LLQPVSAKPPQLRSAAAYIIDGDNNVVLAKNAFTPRPIASISKLIVANVLMGSIEASDREIVIDGTVQALLHGLLPRHDRKLHNGTTLTPIELLNIALISSNNLAISALTYNVGLETVMAAVNATMAASGFNSVTLVEPTGLSALNVANAHDLAMFALTLVNTDVARISVMPAYVTHGVTFNTTNVFVRLPTWEVLVQKTGFTNAAGRCVLMVINVRGQLYSIALLGARSKQDLWQDVVAIRRYLGDDNFVMPQLQPQLSKKRSKIRQVVKQPSETTQTLLKRAY
jgi:D-alanyl-D-alanine endopeptidase (penicillin-binding protein 7)